MTPETLMHNTHAGTDVAEIRRRNLQKVIDQRFSGIAGLLADAVVRPRPNIYQILSGDRPFGEKNARSFERALNLRCGALDLDTDCHNSSDLTLREDFLRLSPARRRIVCSLVAALLDEQRCSA